MQARPTTHRRGLVARVGEVAILEGDATLVSGEAGQYGLRLDEARNDVAAVCARFAQAVADRAAVLVVFTAFDDQGGGGPAYFVPLLGDTPGTGLGPLDQRADFGVVALEGFVNMKRLSGHAPQDRLPLLAHEIAHRHLAYLSARPAAGSTVAPALLGRQQAHWHAALHTGGSVLGGHGFVETEPGRFVVARRNDGFGELDLYGLGLLDADEVRESFYIDDPRTQEGFRIPADAQLEIGSVVLGERRTVSMERIVAATGARPRDDRRLELAFALLTAPGQSATSSRAAVEAEAIDGLRLELESAWPEWTRGRGRLCTSLSGCTPEDPPDAGVEDAGVTAPKPAGCRSGPRGDGLILLAFGGGMVARRSRRLRT